MTSGLIAPLAQEGEVMVKMAKIEKPKCPRCESSQSYFRVKDKKHHCRICGHDWEKIELKTEKVK